MGLEKAKVWQSELGTGGPGEGQGGVTRTGNWWAWRRPRWSELNCGANRATSQGEAVRTGNWWAWRRPRWSKQNYWAWREPR